MYKTLTYEKKENIGILTINRPEKLNAISDELTKELKKFLEGLENDEGVRVLIITGAGDKAFVAGADIGELKDRDARKGRRVSRERRIRRRAGAGFGLFNSPRIRKCSVWCTRS
jgi:enoyl-CoA hydratase